MLRGSNHSLSFVMETFSFERLKTELKFDTA